MRSRVLYVSGRLADAQNLSEMVRNLPLMIDHAGTLRQARDTLQQGHYDVILTDSSLPDGTWKDALHLARETPGDIQVIVTDPHADGKLWSEALNFGAYDLLAQPFYAPEVRRILYNACTRGSGPIALAA